MTNRRNYDANSTLARLNAFSIIVANSDRKDAVFAAAAETADELIGHKLFTIMAFDAAATEVERLYSSNPESYPPGGRKKKADTAWGRQVLEKGEPYIGHTADDICLHFNDHDVILGLGLESVLNMPIRCAGKTLGTMNLLHERNYYKKEDIKIATLVAGLLISSLV